MERRKRYWWSTSEALVLMLLLLTIGTHSAGGWSINHRIVKAANQSYFMVESDATIRPLPDEYTAKRLFHDLNHTGCSYCDSIPVANETVLSSFKISTKYNPTLKYVPYENADECLRVLAQEAEYLEYPSWWVSLFKLGDMMNPSIVRWHGKYLIVARIAYDFKLTRLHWMKDDMTGIDPSAVHLGIRSGFNIEADGNQEDARAFIMKNNSLLIVYGRTFADHSFMTYVVGTYIEKDNVVRWSPSNEMHHANFSWTFNKNWMPFESSHKHDNNVYWMQYVNPPQVLVEKEPFRITEDRKSEFVNIYGADWSRGEEYLQKKTNIPWSKAKYGTPRGGSPMINIRGNLVTFFHTLVTVQHSNPWRHTYLMGAIMYNSKPPFNILKTSKVPIFNFGREGFYTDHWLFNSIDYVVFPSGQALSEDGKHLWVSLGYRDGEGWLGKLEVDGFLSSFHDFDESDDTFGFNATSGFNINLGATFVTVDNNDRRLFDVNRGGEGGEGGGKHFVPSFSDEKTLLKGRLRRRKS